MFLGVASACFIDERGGNQGFNGETLAGEASLASSINFRWNVIAHDFDLPANLALKDWQFRMIIPGCVLLNFFGDEGAEVEVPGHGKKCSIGKSNHISVPKV